MLKERDLKAEMEFIRSYSERYGKKPKPYEVNMAVYGEPSPSFQRIAKGAHSAMRRRGMRYAAIEFILDVLRYSLSLGLGITLAYHILRLTT